MKKIGVLIANARKKAGLTQEAFAAKLGLTPQAVSKWENDVGFPDVALLPEIANILGLSLDELFGIDEDGRGGFSDVFSGLPLVHTFEDAGLYSDKTVSNIDTNGFVVMFSDGSRADMKKGEAINCGTGEIRFKKRSRQKKRGRGVKNFAKALDCFDSVKVWVSFSTELEMLTAENGQAKVSAEGDEEFIESLVVDVADSCLHIEARKNNASGNSGGENKIKLFVPFSNGKSLDIRTSGSADCEIKPVFDNLSISVSGSGDINATGCSVLNASVSGSSDINLDRVLLSGVIKVSGSGDINVKEGKDLVVSVSGSGDIDVDRIRGRFDATVNGAADIKIGGELDELWLQFNGSGAFDGRKLAVKNADITVRGAGNITIDRIQGVSTERLGENCNYNVFKRG